MLAWISETIMGVFAWVPNLLYEDDSPRYLIVRSMLGLLLIVLIAVAVAFWRNRRQSNQGRETN